jgi:hypothetical protein
MLNLIIGYWVSRLIYVAAKLELADLLDDGRWRRFLGHGGPPQI